MNKIAVYAGSFDPVTNGHLDVLKRAAGLFSTVIIAVVVNPSKKSLFSVQERVDMLTNTIGDLPNVKIDSFQGLLIDYVRQQQGNAIVRGLRAASDFEYEFQMAHTNKQLAPEIETVFIAADNRYTFISSNIVKEIAALGGSVDGMVPSSVARRLVDRQG
ncbi:MAG: pantetheine-phosphate adenylyltransferase [Spirochaetaceae bacterium]|nr:MAG: pantetheine-phosphate adenylyltransferase [Spirochaetaceae bacterium]